MLVIGIGGDARQHILDALPLSQQTGLRELLGIGTNPCHTGIKQLLRAVDQFHRIAGHGELQCRGMAHGSRSDIGDCSYIPDHCNLAILELFIRTSSSANVL